MGYPLTTGDFKDLFRDTADLDDVQRSLIREQTIRGAMAQTGESRVIVEEMLDASVSMMEEGVLTLLDGEPTTLRNAVEALVEKTNLEFGGCTPYDEEGRTRLEVAEELSALLAYRFPEGDGPATSA